MRPPASVSMRPGPERPVVLQGDWLGSWRPVDCLDPGPGPRPPQRDHRARTGPRRDVNGRLMSLRSKEFRNAVTVMAIDAGVSFVADGLHGRISLGWNPGRRGSPSDVVDQGHSSHPSGLGALLGSAEFSDRRCTVTGPTLVWKVKTWPSRHEHSACETWGHRLQVAAHRR